MKSFFLFILILFTTFSVDANPADCNHLECIAVVDSGSSGSRLHIYSYERDQTNTPINIKELWSKKIKPGLTTLESSQEVMNNYLTNLFAESPFLNLPVYFYSTAGMRLLASGQQKQIYNYINNWFLTQPQWHLKKAKTITGKEEGLFGWLAINYQLGTLNSDTAPVGVMDMGGASVQISFPIQAESAPMEQSDLMQFELYGRQKILFSHSFLGLGQTEVTHQYLDSPFCFANNYELPNGRLAKGNAYHCKTAVAALLNKVHHVNRIVQPILSRNNVNNWVIIGGMAELLQSKPFQFEGKRFTNESLINQANAEVCQKQWETVGKQYEGNDYYYGYCLFPAYYYALIVDGYGIQPQKSMNYQSSKDGGDWTIGVVLAQKE